MADDKRCAPFERAKGKFGFGCMRLPLLEDQTVDNEAFCKMVDAFLAAGLNYFDTAKVYLKGQSEVALRDCLTSRYAREKYVLTDKLTASCFERRQDIRPLLEQQLKTLGVGYLDLYLMHAQSSQNYEKYQACHAYEEAFAAREAGLVRHVGISFHDSAEALEGILTDHPDVEVVQLQLNYLDWESIAIQSRACWEVCRRHNKPVMVMEPVKGGTLVNLPQEAREVLAEVAGRPFDPQLAASYALRFAAGLEGVEMVLSGMGSQEMVDGNVATFSPFAPLTDAERDTLDRVVQIINSGNSVPCTACRYCVDGCPKHIPIPDVFSCLNSQRSEGGFTGGFYYKVLTDKQGVGCAADCVRCGLCEKACPQHLPIRDLLAQANEELAGK